MDKPPVRLQKLPLDTIKKCREAAKKAGCAGGWGLPEWDAFRDEATGWLQPGAEDFEDAMFEDVVRRFFQPI